MRPALKPCEVALISGLCAARGAALPCGAPRSCRRPGARPCLRRPSHGVPVHRIASGPGGCSSGRPVLPAAALLALPSGPAAPHTLPPPPGRGSSRFSPALGGWAVLAAPPPHRGTIPRCSGRRRPAASSARLTPAAWFGAAALAAWCAGRRSHSPSPSLRLAGSGAGAARWRCACHCPPPPAVPSCRGAPAPLCWCCPCQLALLPCRLQPLLLRGPCCACGCVALRVWAWRRPDRLAAPRRCPALLGWATPPSAFGGRRPDLGGCPRCAASVRSRAGCGGSHCPRPAFSLACPPCFRRGFTPAAGSVLARWCCADGAAHRAGSCLPCGPTRSRLPGRPLALARPSPSRRTPGLVAPAWAGASRLAAGGPVCAAHCCAGLAAQGLRWGRHHAGCVARLPRWVLVEARLRGCWPRRWAARSRAPALFRCPAPAPATRSLAAGRRRVGSRGRCHGRLCPGALAPHSTRLFARQARPLSAAPARPAHCPRRRGSAPGSDGRLASSA